MVATQTINVASRLLSAEDARFVAEMIDLAATHLREVASTHRITPRCQLRLIGDADRAEVLASRLRT